MSNNNDSHDTTGSAHWSEIKETSTLTGMRILLAAYKTGGNWLFKPLLAPVILYYYLSNRAARQSSNNFLTVIGKHKRLTQPMFWLSLKHFWLFGCAMLDKLAAWQDSIDYNDIDTHNRDIMLDLIAQKRGGVLMISHLGNFEICRALRSTNLAELKLTILVHTKHAEKFNQILNQHSSERQVDLLQVTEITPASAMLLSERCSNGGFVVIAGDRSAVGYSNSIEVDFLGKPAPLPRGPYMLAAILKAPLVSLTSIKENGRYQLYFDSISDAVAPKRSEREQVIAQLAQRYASLLEKYCLQAPLQWFNFYEFWSPNDKQH